MDQIHQSTDIVSGGTPVSHDFCTRVFLWKS